MIRNKAFKFRLYPNKKQELLILDTINACRFIYNQMLEDKINYYKENKQTLNNTPAQYKDKFDFLKFIDAYALCNEQINLQRAFNNFFRNPKFGFPKFKSKKICKWDYTTNNCNNGLRLEGNKIKLPKIGLVNIVAHRSISDNYKIKSATITKERSGKFYISILTEYENQIPVVKLNPDNSIGLDYSSHDFYVDSNGLSANYPKMYRKYEPKLAREQRKLSKMEKNSHNYFKQKIKVARIHEKISNCRSDFLNRLSIQLANQYDYIFVEDLNMQGISQALKLGKSTFDNSFGMFRYMLKYKLEERGKIFHIIDKFTPTSQTCHICGCKSLITKDLSIRSWTCPECGAELDRDTNAAINIKTAGLFELGLT